MYACVCNHVGVTFMTIQLCCNCWYVKYEKMMQVFVSLQSERLSIYRQYAQDLVKVLIFLALVLSLELIHCMQNYHLKINCNVYFISVLMN